MRLRHLVSATLLATLVAGCDTDELLQVDPATEVAADVAIIDAVSARSAVLAMYDALQDASYYGEQLLTFSDLSSDNAVHTGTFTGYADADQNRLTSEVGEIEGMWDAIYSAINRANVILERIPSADFLEEDEAEQMQSEAYFIRALSYHNLVKYFGGVPLRLTPVKTPSDVASLKRATSAEVYAQIRSDLDKAQQLTHTTRSRTRVSLGGIRALRARVLFYQGQYAAAEAEANAVIALGYALAPNYRDLFSESGAPTSEDILRLVFNVQDANSISFYYLDRSLGGRRELGPATAFRNSWSTTDLRRQWTIGQATSTRFYVNKYRSATGTEHLHIIRLAEVLLIKAESQARQGKLAEAIATLNPIRVRAGLAPLTLGTLTQQQVIDAIVLERRYELAFEGDRWHDLNRLGITASLLGIPAYQTLYPIPQGERDVAQGLDQNPGY